MIAGIFTTTRRKWPLPLMFGLTRDLTLFRVVHHVTAKIGGEGAAPSPPHTYSTPHDTLLVKIK